MMCLGLCLLYHSKCSLIAVYTNFAQFVSGVAWYRRHRTKFAIAVNMYMLCICLNLLDGVIEWSTELAHTAIALELEYRHLASVPEIGACAMDPRSLHSDKKKLCLYTQEDISLVLKYPNDNWQNKNLIILAELGIIMGEYSPFCLLWVQNIDIYPKKKILPEISSSLNASSCHHTQISTILTRAILLMFLLLLSPHTPIYRTYNRWWLFLPLRKIS